MLQSSLLLLVKYEHGKKLMIIQGQFIAYTRR
ncbi:MAG: hypothetical protein ACFWT3_00480 [Pseudomonas lundensis]|jgi:hypothetical protein